VVTEHSGYQLHEALLTVACAPIPFAPAQTLSTRMTRSSPDGFVSGTTVAGAIVNTTTDGINFLISSVKDPG
jgi:hypothetical protein